jgi:hypothetical protein
MITISLLFSRFVNAQDFITFDQVSIKPLTSQLDNSNVSAYRSNFVNDDITDDLEKYLTSIQLATFLYLEYGIEHHTTNNKTSTPNKLDSFFRDKIKWGPAAKEDAESASDILLYGDIIWTMTILPFFSENGYLNMLKTSLDVISLNGIVTDLVKMSVKRQRPDSYFKTREDTDDSFRSFFSGHTSTTFAIGTSNAIMLSEIYPDKRIPIWIGNLSLAAATGYLRIAGDKHYMSDVICGGLVGYGIARMVHKTKEMKKINIGLGTAADHLSLNLSLRL